MLRWLKWYCRLLFLKHVCEAALALILLSLLDVGACLLGDFVALCHCCCCGEWEKWGVFSCSLSFSEWKHVFDLLSKPHSSLGNSLNATPQRMSKGEKKLQYINDKRVMWSLLSPFLSPYFSFFSFTLVYPHLMFFFISPVFCSPALHCLGTFCDIVIFHYHFIYHFISLFFSTFLRLPVLLLRLLSFLPSRCFP